MISLIQNISTAVIQSTSSTIELVSKVDASVFKDNKQDITTFLGYIQDFSRVEYTELLNNPFNYGLKNTRNKKTDVLNITY